MKILLLHAAVGSGHTRAAEALARALQTHAPSAQVIVRDILDFTPRLFRRTYVQGYLNLLRAVPELWSYMYNRVDRKAHRPLDRKVRRIFTKLNTLPFFRFYDQLAPDCTICTHFMPLELLACRKKAKAHKAPLFGVVTDFAVHALWIAENVDCYYVATKEAKWHLMRKGLPSGRIEVLGIPVDSAFARAVSPMAQAVSLGLKPHLPTVLTICGGARTGPMLDLIGSFNENDLRLNLIVVTGKNEKIRRKVETVARGLPIPVRVFGFTNNIHELMNLAVVVITKPGGLTSSEVLARGKPMIVFNPIPGQEQRNCEYLLESGVAIRLFDVTDAPDTIRFLLNDQERLDQLCRNARLVAKPQAARDIVADIMARLHA